MYEVYKEGSPVLMLPDEAPLLPGFSVERLVNAGLVKRAVLVSCRRTGHTLFQLPSSDALSVVTVSKATCSECGISIEDEKVEEAYVPTQLSASLLEDGSWLVTCMHAVLRELGLPESEIAIAPATGDGDAHMIANVCGESFLFVLRDGDLTPSFARRAIDLSLETKSTHLVVVATGKIQQEGRVRLLDYARRRARGGQDMAVLMLQDAGAAMTEILHTFERVSQRVIAAQLCELDASIGFNVSRMIITRSQLLQKAPLKLAAFSS
ncbi:MAG: hypothetical protein H0W99_09020 [Acidobacteria bacterium]|nr:hypothetical protein [Acidobacteriota bacterium]